MKSPGKLPILARVLRDCAEKIQVEYLVKEPMSRARTEVFESFDPGSLEVQEFSRFVPGAKDLFRFLGQEREVLVTGILDESRFLVTYGRLGTLKQRDQELRRSFEGFLQAQGFGDYLVEDRSALDSSPKE